MGKWRSYWIDIPGSVTTPGQAKILEDSMRETNEVAEVREKLVSGRDVLERLLREAVERSSVGTVEVIPHPYDMAVARAWRQVAAELYTLLAAPWFEEAPRGGGAEKDLDYWRHIDGAIRDARNDEESMSPAYALVVHLNKWGLDIVRKKP